MNRRPPWAKARPNIHDVVRSPIGGATGSVFPSDFAGPLDSYTTNLEGAYSVSRRLLSSYTGSLIRIREDGGNTELDIGYDANGDLDTAAAAAHIGVNNGFVVTVYDQSGNSRNVTNATAGNQPGYSATGFQSKPSLVANGTSATLNSVAAGWSALDAAGTVLLAETAPSGTFDYSFTAGTNDDYFVLLVQSLNSYAFYAKETTPTTVSDTSLTVTPAATAGTNAIIAADWDYGSACNFYHNGNEASENPISLATQAANATIGQIAMFGNGRVSSADSHAAPQAELLVYGAVLSDVTRQAIEANMTSYYGL